jgi:hypothetical protein
MIFGRLWEDSENGGHQRESRDIHNTQPPRRTFQQRESRQQHAPVRSAEPEQS